MQAKRENILNNIFYQVTNLPLKIVGKGRALRYELND